MIVAFWIAVGNLLVAMPLAAVAWLFGRWGRPALAHGLWVLVLLKLVTPPLGTIPFALPSSERTAEVEAVASVQALEGTPRPQAPLEIDPPRATARPETLEPVELEIGPGNDVTVAEEVLPLPELLGGPAPAETPASAPVASAVVHAPLARPWLLEAVVSLWLAGSGLFFVAALRRALRFRRLLARGLPVCQELQVRVDGLARDLGVTCPQLVALPGLVSPALWVGLRHAYLIVPRDLFARLGSDQQVALLLHELAHWRRGDHWVRRLELVALGLYWWCPLVWWARLELQQAEEECCDAWVVATAPESARAYALAILETVDFLDGARPALPPLASGLGPFRSLQRRLTMIFRVGTPRSLTAAGFLGLAALAFLLLPWSPAPAPSAVAQGEGPERGKKEFKEKKEFRDKDREKEREKAGPPDKKFEFRPDFKPDFKPGGDDFDRLREAAKRRQAELEQMQRELSEKMRELATMMEKLRQAEGGRGGEGPGPGPGRLFKPKFDGEPKPGLVRTPGAPGRPGGEGPPGGDLDRRIGEVERKLDMLIWELGNLRREMGNRGPMGPGGFGGGFGGPGAPGFRPGAGNPPGRRPEPEGRERNPGEERGPAPVPVPERKRPDGPRDQ